MKHVVRVRRPSTKPAPEILRATLGEQPLPLNRGDFIPAPWITIDERIHAPTTDFLWQHCRSSPHLGTATRIATDLARWLRFLLHERGLLPHENHRDPVLLATEDDFAAFYRASQYPDANPGASRDAAAYAQTAARQLLDAMAASIKVSPSAGRTRRWESVKTVQNAAWLAGEMLEQHARRGFTDFSSAALGIVDLRLPAFR